MGRLCSLPDKEEVRGSNPRAPTSDLQGFLPLDPPPAPRLRAFCNPDAWVWAVRASRTAPPCDHPPILTAGVSRPLAVCGGSVMKDYRVLLRALAPSRHPGPKARVSASSRARGYRVEDRTWEAQRIRSSVRQGGRARNQRMRPPAREAESPAPFGRRSVAGQARWNAQDRCIVGVRFVVPPPWRRDPSGAG